LFPIIPKLLSYFVELSIPLLYLYQNIHIFILYKWMDLIFSKTVPQTLSTVKV